MKKSLYVYCNFGIKRFKVGELFFSDTVGKYAFAYDREFIKTGLELSPQVLPLLDDTFFAERNEDWYDIHPPFADSLPDSWGRMVQDQEFEKIKLYEVTALDRLAFVGLYGIGALQYEPSLAFELGREIVTLAQLRKAAQSIINGDFESVAKKLAQLGGSAGGALPKFLVDLNAENNNEVRYSSGTYTPGMIPVLLKVPTRDDIWQRVEYAYSQMAYEAGITIPQTYLLTSASGSAFFAIERFDINRTGERFHAQTFSGLDGFSAKSGQRDYIQFLRTINNLCHNHEDVKEGFRRMVFNYLAANEDDHGKNFTFIMDHTGKWMLAPAYDLGFSDHGGIHRMPVNNKRSSLLLRDIEFVAQKLDIKQYKDIVTQIIEALKQWKTFAKNAVIGVNMVKKIGDRIDIHLKRVLKDYPAG